MGTQIIISSTNFSGQIGTITLYPLTGGTVSLGSHQLPYTLDLDYYYGSYDIFFSAYSNTCSFDIDLPPSPTPTNTMTATVTPSVSPTTTATQTQTPSRTPTQTATPTNTSSPTPSSTIGLTPTATSTLTLTPTNTPSVTQTNTPSSTPTLTPTSTIEPICPEQITLSSSSVPEYNGTYNRLYSYTGGTFNYAYFEGGGVNVWRFDTTDASGNYGVVWGRLSGGIYYTLYAVAQSSNIINLYGVFSSNTNYIVGSVVSGSTIVDITPEISSGVKYPTRGNTGTNNFYVSFPETCPTATPTVSVTQTNTPSITPTQTKTPSPTPTSGVTGCLCYRLLNETGSPINYQYDDCVLGATSGTLSGGASTQVCAVDLPVIDPGGTITPCTSVTNCDETADCTGCS